MALGKDHLRAKWPSKSSLQDEILGLGYSYSGAKATHSIATVKWSGKTSCPATDSQLLKFSPLVKWNEV